jgi:uncharacterized membrane protein required for colicin V production
MNMLDVAILAVVGTLAILGVRRGFMLGALDLVGIGGGVLVAALYYRRVIDPLIERGLPREAAAVVAFAGLNVVTLVAMSLLINVVFRPIRRLPWPFFLRWGDSLFGLIPGLIKGVAVAAVVIMPLAFLQRPLLLSTEIEGSRLAGPLVAGGFDVLSTAVDRYDLDLAEFSVITSRPAEDGITLPFTVTTGLTVDGAAENEILRLVNQERAQAGLAPVTLDPALREVGRAHGEEMFRLGYFAHVSPVSGTPGDRLEAADIAYLASGENLAFAPSIRIAHAGLMNSPSHRANILNPLFTRLGVGVVSAEHRGLMVVQEFAV